jgi:arylsulfatase
VRRYLNLLKIGIASGLVIGGLSAWHSGQFHFEAATYRKAFLGPVLTMDVWALALAVLFCMMRVALVIYGIYERRRMQGETNEETRQGESQSAQVLLRLEQALAHRKVFIPLLSLLIMVNATAGFLRLKEDAIMRNRPNVILIMVDTLRADHLSCYGYSRKTTPNIDGFAAGAIRFRKAISQAPATKWSVPSFLTSEYPQDRERNFHDNIATILQKNGYITAGIVSNPQVDGLPGVYGGWDFWNTTMCSKDVSSPGIVDNALKFLSDLPKRRRPFFLFALFMDPHSPYISHAGYVFDPNYHGPLKNQAAFPDTIAESHRLTAPCDVEHLKALYDSDIAFTDASIGKFLTELKKRGLYDNSLIVFLADHGEEFNDHGDFFHAKTLYNELLSVPVIVKLPSQHKGRVVGGGAFQLIDLAPSVLESVGIDPKMISPQGVAVNFSTATSLPDRAVFSATRPKLRAVQNARYKLIQGVTPYSTKRVSELYDLKLDPKEHHNLLPGMEQVAKPLRDELVKQDADVAANIRAVHQIVIDRILNHKMTNMPKAPTPEQKERLNSLGYLGR